MKKTRISRIFLIIFTVILALVASLSVAACDINNLFNFGKGDGNSATTPDNSGGGTGGNTEETPGGSTGGNTEETPGGSTGGNTEETPGGSTGGNTEETPGGGTGGNTEQKPDTDIVAGDKSDIVSSKLSIHFLELGTGKTGDSILIKCGNTEVLIDAGAIQGSAATLKSYINQYCTDGKLEYVITTHADTDHIAAFIGNSSGGKYNGIMYSYEIGTIIKFSKTGINTAMYNNYLNAVEYAKGKGAEVYTASQCYDETDGAKRQYFLDEEHTVSINILYNYYYYNLSGDENNHSVVTLLTEEYDGGRRNYLFTGDLETDGESKMVDYYRSVPEDHATEYNILPEVELYKAGHHGSGTSSTLKLLDVIKPKYVTVCCCAGSPQYSKENIKTFPTQQMIDNVAKYTDKIFVTTLCTSVNEKDENGNYKSQNHADYTSLNGNIVFYSLEGEIKLYCSNNDTILKETDWFKENRTWPSGSE